MKKLEILVDEEFFKELHELAIQQERSISDLALAAIESTYRKQPHGAPKDLVVEGQPSKPFIKAVTHTDQIMAAVKQITATGRMAFTRQLVRDEIGLKGADRNASYGPTFQAMRDDHPGGAPPIGMRFRGVFHRESHGMYHLTKYGYQLLREF